MNKNLIKKTWDDNFGITPFVNNLSRLFDDFLTIKPIPLFDTDWTPSINVDENEKSIKITAEIPGIDEKDLNVTLEDRVLTLSGVKREERTEEDKDRKYHYSERKFGSFSRSITMPKGIESDKVHASFKNGLLKIDIPKIESTQPKKVEIKVEH